MRPLDPTPLEFAIAIEVDAAVAQGQAPRPTGAWRVPRTLGWPVCSEAACALPIAPGWRVSWGPNAFHPECASDRLRGLRPQPPPYLQLLAA